MAALYTSLAGWIPRPAPFNASKRGTLVELSEKCSVAERVRPTRGHKNGVVYTAQPVPVGEVWRITVLNTICTWSGGLRVGLTSELPSDVPVDLHNVDGQTGSHEWVFTGCLYHNNKSTHFENPPSIGKLTPGQSVGLLVTPSGQLHLFLNEEHCLEIATGIPVNTPLWGAASLYANCTKIKSEIMSGGHSAQRIGLIPYLKKKPTSLTESKTTGDMQTPATEDIQTEEPLKSTIAASDLVISDTSLGDGAQGMVWEGKWKGLVVAVKKCLQPSPKDVHVLLSLGPHPNIIRLYGIVAEKYSCCIVTELVKGGSLFDFIHKQKKVPSDEQRSYWMKDIATGMEFLHHQEIAHRDLKSANVLLGDRMTAKLCDFGTARSLDHTTSQSTVTGTYRWMAPEVVHDPNARINKKCDVYSYGMVLYELVTLKLPFHDAPTDQMAMVNAVIGKRPSLPESDSECPLFLRNLITACWNADSKARPSFQKINIALDTKAFPQQ